MAQVLDEIVWVDSSKSVTGDIIKENGYKLAIFNETQDCIDYIAKLKRIDNYKRIKGIITSSMRSGGRQKNGYLDGFQMINVLFSTIWSRNNSKQLPVTALVTSSIKKTESDKHGIDIYSYGNRNGVQNKIIEQIKDKFQQDQHIADDKQME